MITHKLNKFFSNSKELAKVSANFLATNSKLSSCPTKEELPNKIESLSLFNKKRYFRGISITPNTLSSSSIFDRWYNYVSSFQNYWNNEDGKQTI